jgi:hypothetical protein
MKKLKRTTIMLPDELRIRALKRARHSGKSLGALIRELLVTALGHPARTTRKDSFFSDKVSWGGRSARDGATRHDKYLYDPKP